MHFKIARAQMYWSSRMTIAAALTVLKGEMLEGKASGRFERALARYLGARFVVLTASGKMSLHLCLKGLGLQAGDEVVVPAYTVPEVVEVILACGLVPVFVDIDRRTFNLDPSRLSAAITGRTRVIVATHMYGNLCELDEVMGIAAQHRLAVIEDAAQAIGAQHSGRKVGTIGLAGYYSFGVMKHFNALGGSAIVTNDEDFYRNISELSRPFPQPRRRRLLWALLKTIGLQVLTNPLVFSALGFHVIRLARLLGGNFLYKALAGRPVKERFPENFLQRDRVQFTNMQSTIGLLQLEALDRNNERRTRHAELLDEALGGVSASGITGIRSQYVLLMKNRDGAMRQLVSKGIDATNGYVENCASRFVSGPAAGTFVNSALAEEQNVYVPIYPSLSDDQVRYIAACVSQVR